MRVFLFVTILITALFSKEYKVGFAQDTLANDWRIAQVEDVKNEIAKYNFLKLTIKDAKAKVSNQISDIEFFIKNDYDFIITSPINAKITSFVLKKAIKKGIKVILLDRDITSDDYTVFISTDNRLMAKKAALFMAKKMNYKGKVLMLEGIKGASVTIDRREAFEDVMKKYPNIDIIKYRGNFLRNDTIRVMGEIHKNRIKYDAIYSHSDSMLSGVRSFYKNNHIKKDILNVGIDFISEAKEAIIKNEQDASFTNDTCGKEGVLAIVDIINKKEVPKNIVIKTKMVTKDNVFDIEAIF